MKAVSSLLVALVLVLPLRARADGAFPDSLSMYAFGDRPGEVIVATNFGLLATQDDGKTWQWTCEDAILAGVVLYQAGPGPDHPLYAIAPDAAAVSVDDACSWASLGPPLAGGVVSDVFPDPTDERHAFAIGAELANGALQPLALYETRDTGASFQQVEGMPADAEDGTTQLVSIESSKSEPNVVYVTRTVTSPAQAVLLMRSDDGGATWTTHDLTGTLGPYRTAIAAVDPDDADTVYLRVLAAGGDELAITHDGGVTLSVPLQLQTSALATGAMSAFLRRADGSLIVGTQDADQYVSSDHGQTFSKWNTPIHLRAIAERGATLYGAGSEFQDGFLFGKSVDDGQSWTGLLTYEQICQVPDCVAGVCTDALNALRLSLGLSDCKATTDNPPPAPKPAKQGCGCAGASGGVVALLGLALRRRSRRRG